MVICGEKGLFTVHFKLDKLKISRLYNSKETIAASMQIAKQNEGTSNYIKPFRKMNELEKRILDRTAMIHFQACTNQHDLRLNTQSEKVS